MGLLSYTQLVELVSRGVINAKLSQINGASIDITLDAFIRMEGRSGAIDLSAKENIETVEYEMTPSGYLLAPGEFILASSIEEFNLPNTIVAEYVQKSSLARNGLNHCLAGYADPGWHSSKLTLELFNVTRCHQLRLRPGMPIGQMKFFQVAEVPSHASYAIRGQYNNQEKVTASKGIR